MDNVIFCRDKFKYDEGGCAAGKCEWSDFGEQHMAALGGVDGFEFTPFDQDDTIIVVDVNARLEACQSYADQHYPGNRRRLQQAGEDANHAEETSRFIGALRKAKN